MRVAHIDTRKDAPGIVALVVDVALPREATTQWVLGNRPQPPVVMQMAFSKENEVRRGRIVGQLVRRSRGPRELLECRDAGALARDACRCQMDRQSRSSGSHGQEVNSLSPKRRNGPRDWRVRPTAGRGHLPISAKVRHPTPTHTHAGGPRSSKAFRRLSESAGPRRGCLARRETIPLRSNAKMTEPRTRRNPHGDIPPDRCHIATIRLSVMRQRNYRTPIDHRAAASAATPTPLTTPCKLKRNTSTERYVLPPGLRSATQPRAPSSGVCGADDLGHPPQEPR